MAAEKKVDTTGLLGWIDHRFPATVLWKRDVAEYYAPKNFNFWYIFGSLAMLVLVIQIVTGIFLVMHYKPDAEKAFASVEYIMRDVPWGQMSYWGAQVIVNLFSAIPVIGEDLSIWIRGDYVVGDATLNRFFSFHVIAIPLVLLGLAVAHIIALHEVGSNNPDGIEIKAKKDANGVPLDGIPFHPYYSVHDAYGVAVFLFIFSAVIFFAPEMGGYFLEYNNFIPADPLKTPPHIAPVWYFTPFYSILRATTTEFLTYGLLPFLLVLLVFILKSARYTVSKLIGTVVILGMCGGFFLLDAKFWGVVAMGASTLIFFSLPWIDQSPVKSIRYRPLWHKAFYAVFVVAFLVLGYFGVQPPSPTAERLSQLCTLIYFGFFLFMPWWTQAGTFKQPPERVNFKPHH